MDLLVFQNLSSQDPQIQSEATQRIEEASQSTEFLDFLFQSLHEAIQSGNTHVIKPILIVIVYNTKLHPSYFINIASNDQQRRHIAEILFSLSEEDRPHIEECLTIIAEGDSEGFAILLKDIFDSVDFSESMLNAKTAMRLSSRYQKQSISYTFPSMIYSHVRALFEVSRSKIDQKDSLELLSHIASFIRHSFAIDKYPIDDVVVSGLVELIPIVQKPVSDSICRLITDFLKPGRNMPHGLIENVLEQLEIAIDNVSPITKSSYFIKLCYSLVLSDRFVDSMMTPQFIADFVVPAASLTQTDLDDFETNPAVFIASNLDDDGPVGYSTRQYVMRYIDLIISNYIHRVDPSEAIQLPSDPILLEANISVLERYSKSLPFDPDLFEHLVPMIERDDVIAASIVKLVGTYQSVTELTQCVKTSEHILLASQSAVVRFAAAQSLLHCLISLGDDLAEFGPVLSLNSNELYQPLMELAEETQSSIPTTLIERLFVAEGSCNASAAIEVIERFFLLWRSNEGSLVTAPSIIRSIEGVLETLPSSELSQELLTAVLRQLAADITEYPDGTSVSQQIRAAAVISRKTTHLYPEIIAFCEFILETLGGSEDLPLILTDLAMLICPLVKRFREQVTGLTESLLQIARGIISDSESEPDSISLAIFILAAFVSMKIISPLEVSIAIEFMRAPKTKSSIVAACFVLIASAVYVDKSIVQQIPEEILCERTKLIVECGYRELKCALYVLTSIGKNGGVKSMEEIEEIFTYVMDAKDKYEGKSPRMIEEMDIITLMPYIDLELDSFDELEYYVSVSNILVNNR